MVNGEWLLSLITTMLSLLERRAYHPYTWKCMVPTRDHRDGPPKKATCYASVRRGGTKDPSLNASRTPISIRFVTFKCDVVVHAITWLRLAIEYIYYRVVWR